MPTSRPSRRRWPIRLAASASAVVVLSVVATFVYARANEGRAPAPLSLTAADAEPTRTEPTARRGAASTAAPAAVDVAAVDGSWAVSAGSQAGYRVHETLLGQSSVAVGRTDAVVGTATIHDGALVDAAITVDVTKITSDQALRDSMFHASILDTAANPTASFTLTAPVPLKELPPAETPIAVEVSGDLMVHGVTRPVTAVLQAQRRGETLEVTGAIAVTFADFGVTAPSVGPANTVDDHGTIEFLVTLQRA